uniref:CCHC-type domain-containing protein n=1 Tax=Tanacetum cinerariifolium TaxID=118510 RepID=A0A6L2P7C1_TANCI|nr:hypothetical protein [Tanacetum cinerariifolium]
MAIDVKKDKLALVAIYQGIPEDLLLSLAEKQTAKDAWETLKTMFMGADRVKTAKVQTLKAEFETLSMKDTEIIDDFAMKVNNIVSNVQALREKVEKAYVIKKLLRAVPSKFLQIASTIEQFVDLDNMTVEEVIGRLKAHEERVRRQSKSGEGKLLLTHQEWLERSKKKGNEEQRTSQHNTRSSASNNRESTKKKNQEANLTQKDDEPVLLLVVKHEVNGEVFLNEKHLTQKPRNLIEERNTSKVWYLDNGGSNHMAGIGPKPNPEADDQDKLLMASSNNKTYRKWRGKDFNKKGKESIKWKNNPNARRASTSQGTKDKSKLRCYECGEHGHFAKECTKWKDKKKDKEKKAHLIYDTDTKPTLL